MKLPLASLELVALANELQSLLNSKISQIYQFENQFTFQFHTKKGKQFLRIIPGKFLNLTKTKKVSPKPSSFCMQLRKLLNNSFIRKIEQKDMERILVIELEKISQYLFIIELFAPGNLILTDKNYQILACLHQQKFRDRFIKPKIDYRFPPPTLDWKTLTELQLQKLLEKSQKRSLAVSLATEIGLGGLYAEEVCKLSDIDKNKLPKKAEQKEIKSIIKTIKALLELIKKPAGYIYEEQIAPFPLKGLTPIKKTETYNEAIDALAPFEKTSPYEKKINALVFTIQTQQEAVQKQEEDISINTKKAELIYQHYQPLRTLLEIVKELKKTKTWEEIKAELGKEKKIKKVDLKEKKIVIDL